MKNSLKTSFLLLIILSFTACSSVYTDLEMGLESLKNTPQEQVFNALGYPDTKIELDEETTLFIWDTNKISTHTIPRTNTITNVVNNTLVTRTYTTYSTQNYTNSCTIKYAVKDKKAYKWEFSGDRGTCANYVDRLKKADIL